MAANPRVSIVIVNYQSVWSLSLALKSLYLLETQKDSFEVIVVNNDMAEKRAIEQLALLLPFRLVHSDGNIGFGQGANRAVAYARGGIIGFLNPDIRWLRKNLDEIEAFFMIQPKETVLGLALVDKNGRPERWSKGKAPTLGLILRNKIPILLDSKTTDGKDAFDWVSGGAIFLPKKLFLALGGFEKDFFLYFEDVDFCLRVKERGGRVICDPRFSLEHHGGKSFRSRSAQKSAYYGAQTVYFQRHRPRGEFLIVKLFHQIFSNV